MSRRILLIQTAFLGDVVLTTPMIRDLRVRFPQSRLSVLVNPAAAAVLKSNPDVDEVLVIDKKGRERGLMGMIRFARSLRNRNFDLLLSVHQSHRTSLLAILSRIPERHGYAGAAFARLAYTHKHTRPMQLPEIRRLLQFSVDVFGPTGKTPVERPLLFEDEDSVAAVKALLSDLREPRRPILLAPSSVWPTKRWTPYGFAALAGLLAKQSNSQILLVGSAGDSEVAEQVLAYSREMNPAHIHERITNVCGRTTLLGLYSLIRRSKLLVSNDSAPIHFGCAAGIPTVAVFGPTVQSLGYAPFAPGTAVAELDGLQCRPCGTHGAKVCPVGHFRCMRDLTPEMVLEKVREVENFSLQDSQ